MQPLSDIARRIHNGHVVDKQRCASSVKLFQKDENQFETELVLDILSEP